MASTLLGGGALSAPAVAVSPAQAQVVSAVPAALTPHATNEGMDPATGPHDVRAFAQVGDTMVVGGNFSGLTDPDGTPAYPRTFLGAFDVSTGVVSTTFAPQLDGAVEALAPGPTAGTVLVGGRFRTVNGTARRSVALLDVTTGRQVAGWNAPELDGDVLTLHPSGSRLFLGGNFRAVGGAAHTGPAHQGIAALSLTTGALDDFMSSRVEINHNWTPTSGTAKGPVGVARLDVTPDGRRLVAVGNFKKVDGLDRDQVAMWDLGTTSAVVRPDWRTRGFEAPCVAARFDSYVRDVAFSPDGAYFVVVTSGGTESLCDSATRWESRATGDSVQPTWRARTGGDTLLSVAVTGAAIYVGGHQRWMNNSGSTNSPQPGSVPRPGIAALDPATGLPLAWNPGRNPRGVGASVLYATADGLWMGSDTEFVGNRAFRRKRLAFFPLAGGQPAVTTVARSLPGRVYLGSSATTSTAPVAWRVNAGGPPQQTRDGGVDWRGDTLTAPLAHRLNGQNVSTYLTPARLDATVPPDTPRVMLQSARWDPGSRGDGKEMQWNFRVPAGMPIEVRLYFVGRALTPGTRVFDVSVDGRRIDNLDPTAQAGYAVATMRSFRYISDGNVDIDFFHEIGHPFVTGIEIVKTSGATPAVDNGLRSRAYDGTSVGAVTAESTPIDWRAVRGAVMTGNTLYYGTTDSRLHRRTFDGSTFGPDEIVDPYNDPAWSDVDAGGGQTYRGVPSAFQLEIGDVTSMWLDGKGRLYYTLFKQPGLYYRTFTPDSGVTGWERRTVPGVTMPDVTGAFLAGSTLYYVSRATGNLTKVGFAADGTLVGAHTVVSGPAIDSVDWRSRTLFLGPS